LVALIFLATTGSAAARPLIPPTAPPEACPVGHVVLNVSYSCAAEFTLQGSNGFRVTVSGDPAVGGPGSVDLSVRRGNENVVYSARGRVTPTSMQASFGRLGKVSLRFRPSGKVRRVRVPRKCLKERPPVVTAKLGTFAGSFEFRGERGYTKASTHRVAGAIGDPLANTDKELECETPVTKAQAKRELQEVVLGAADRHAHIAFQASRLPVQLSGLKSPAGGSIPAGDRYLFWLFASERAERVSIFRVVAAVGPASDFVFDDALTTATVTPPAPFTGAGSFRRNGDGSTSWTGNLSVPVPGLGMIDLTAPRFKCELATLAALLQHDEEEAKAHSAS
jgi:hypothetical protein